MDRLGWSDDDLSDLLLKVAPPIITEGPAQAGDGLDNLDTKPSVEIEEEEKPEAPTIPTTGVRMVQLFFDAEQHAEWVKLIEDGINQGSYDTASDLALAALQRFVDPRMDT